jgi:hypothetical protein
MNLVIGSTGAKATASTAGPVSDVTVRRGLQRVVRQFKLA